MSIKTDVEELNLPLLLDSLFDPNNKVLYDLKVDDRDFKEFPNLYSFCMSDNGINSPLWARQFYLCLTFLNEICPSCSTRYKSVDQVPKDMDPREFKKYFTLLKYGVCPKCGRTKVDHYKSGAMNPYSEMAGLAGQRVGKSLQAAIIGAYLTHKFLKLQNPEKIYGVLRTTFMASFVGLTYDKAIEQLWMPYSGLIQNSNWFSGYHAMLRTLEKERGETYLKFGASLHYLHRGIFVYPSGPNRKTLRGNTRFFSAIDEFDFFNTDDSAKDQVKLNGVEVYKSLQNSSLTVRIGWRDAMKRGMFNVPNAAQVNISSPQHARGVLTQTVRNNKTSKKIFCFHLATWEIHPKISEADIAREFADDPEKAKRDFGAVPPDTENQFIDADTALPLFKKNPNWVRIRYVHGKAKNGSLRRAAKIVHQNKPSVLYPTVLSMDAGYSNNAFGLSIGYFQNTPMGRRLTFPVVIEISPEKGVCNLNYTKIAEWIIFPLIEAYNVQAVLADRWNSIKILHDIETKYNLYTEIKSLKYNDFTNFRSYMYDNMVDFPARETDIPVSDLLNIDTGTYPKMFTDRPMDHLLLQLCTIVDTGREVDKGAKLTDDLWRATCLGSSVLLNDEWCKKNLHETKRGGNRGLIAISGATGVYGVTGGIMPVQISSDKPVNVGSVGGIGGLHASRASLYEKFRR